MLTISPVVAMVISLVCGTYLEKKMGPQHPGNPWISPTCTWGAFKMHQCLGLTPYRLLFDCVGLWNSYVLKAPQMLLLGSVG